MMKRTFLIIVAFASFVYCNELDDLEHKKRGVTKGSGLNTVTNGAQKDYTYSIYSQNPNTQNGHSSSSYQSQVPNSFYPNQASSQYYSSANSDTDTPHKYSSQPVVNTGPHQTSQFAPINFVPNPGYQAKYQVVPAKPGHLQVAIVQPPYNFQATSALSYPQTLSSSNPTNYANQHMNPHLGVASNYQPFLSNSFFGHPSQTLFLAQPNQQYNSLLYSNPVPNFFNYYPSSNQPKFNIPYTPHIQPEYDKIPPQNIPKEENEIGSHTSEYTASSDPNSSYKN